MIKFGTVGLELSSAVVRALLACTVEMKEKPYLSVGIDKGQVCATDGHTLVRFEGGEVDPNGRRPEEWSGWYWMRSYVELQLGAAGRNGPVMLAWKTLAARGFPPAHQVEPKDGAEALRAPIGFNAQYMARLELVARACRREREPGEKEAPPLPGVVLKSIMSEFDPMRFTIGEQGYLRAAHVAHFTIMPMRLTAAAPVKAKRAPRVKKAEKLESAT